MHRAIRIGVMVGAVMTGAAAASAAESKPIEQLPRDVMRWATMWTAIPQEMFGVGQEEGPLAALTWGPAKGTVVFVDAATRELWNAAKSNKRTEQRTSGKQSTNPILRYEF